MEVIASVHCHDYAGNHSKGLANGGLHWEDAVNKLVDDVWDVLVLQKSGDRLPDYDVLRKANDWRFHVPAPPLYTNPPPSYDDAIRDLPPDYSTLPLLAERKTDVTTTAPQTPAAKSRNQSSSLLKDRSQDVYIDFENPVGVREHKKKKAAVKKDPTPPPPANSGGGSDNAGDDHADGDGAGGDARGGGGGGDGDGDGGAGDDDWNAWTVSGSKKKSKKKEEEEEEERKAAEASAANNLSWADDVEDGGDDSWAGFATVGKKKKGKVRLLILAALRTPLTCVRSPKLRLERSKM